ncbi:hypothetical protein BOX15_Mlig002073g1 [Macrostomum lignano]|uniref:Uncharacterized protein n=1 Tax=Macrostomum lignano TaxID=282301 RepID=A0A267EIR4_9PLAT|nr:hypothetical protein BOX15_Mlig002073g2 [Macrostomum lignano]PAA60844.1 hypothetical protein BOX15_Mlig002073g1 [Macrostomum lignano]
MSGEQQQQQEQLACVSHWFSQWGPAEKAEFLTDLVLAAAPSALCQSDEGLFLVCSRLSIAGQQQPSLFRCQLRLFRDWFANWPAEMRNRLAGRLEQLDPAFAAEFYRRLAATADPGAQVLKP